jgi:hypothetical protein
VFSRLPDKFYLSEAVPKLQFLEQLLTLGKNCISRKDLTYKELAIFFSSLFRNQPGFGTGSSGKIIYLPVYRILKPPLFFDSGAVHAPGI